MDLVVVLDKSTTRPLHKQLCDAITAAVLNGQIKPGEAVPSTRELAHLLAVSRSTVRRSYDELIDRGILVGIQGGKTLVCERPNIDLSLPATNGQTGQTISGRTREARLSAFSRHLMQQEESMVPSCDQSLESNFWAPPTSQIPLSTWRPLVLKACKLEEPGELLSLASDRFGYLPLRQSLSNYLIRARSLNCSPEHIAIFSGSNPLDFLLRLIAKPGDTAVVENPGYPTARKLFQLHDMNVQAVNVDQDGLIVDELFELENVRLVYLTPSHQDPTGAVMSLSRRQRLLSWAMKHHVLIIEDDYDNEFNYEGRALPSLKALDSGECVIYWQAFWKIFGDYMKLNFMVLPQTLIEPVRSAKLILERGLPLIEQVALNAFISEGHLERHLKRANYNKQRQALIYNLTKQFGKQLSIPKTSAGMHLMVRFQPKYTDEAILKSARAASLPVISTRAYWVGEPCRGEFIVPFAQLEEETIGQIVEVFARQLEQS